MLQKWQCLTLCAADVRFGEVAWSDTVHYNTLGVERWYILTLHAVGVMSAGVIRSDYTTRLENGQNLTLYAASTAKVTDSEKKSSMRVTLTATKPVSEI